jgi:hypothetical protein
MACGQQTDPSHTGTHDMKKTLLVTLLLSLGPVAASAGGTGANSDALATTLDMACALQQSECAVIERRIRID